MTLVALTQPKSVNVLDGRLIVKILVTKRLGEKPTWLRIPDSKIWRDRPSLFTDNLPIIPPSSPHTHTHPFFPTPFLSNGLLQTGVLDTQPGEMKTRGIWGRGSTMSPTESSGSLAERFFKRRGIQGFFYFFHF